jgi:membrane peptidoglycan carboxypeptidase
MATAVQETPRRARRDVRRRLGIGSLALLGLLAGVAGAIYGDLPGVGDAQARIAAELRAHHSRSVLVPPDERVARAVVAIEDRRFFNHGAIDPIAVARVIGHTLTQGPVDPGGSTIAQQLAKVLYREGGGLGGELDSIGLAFKLEGHYSKATILSMYLNAVYFGHGFYGIEAASRGYFGRTPSRLTWAQASLLAGLPQAPSSFDPFRNPQAARARQREVLAALVRKHAITPSGARRIEHEPLRLR